MSRSDNVNSMSDSAARSVLPENDLLSDYTRFMNDAVVRPSSSNDQKADVFSEDLAEIYRSCLSSRRATCSEPAKPTESGDSVEKKPNRSSCSSPLKTREIYVRELDLNDREPEKPKTARDDDRLQQKSTTRSEGIQHQEPVPTVTEEGPLVDSTATKIHTVLTMFDDIDANHDGFLSDVELKAETKNWGSRTRQESEAISAIENAREVIEEASNDQWFSDDGISPADLIMYDSKFLAVATAGKYFYEIDKDVDGTMTKAELSNFALKHPEESLAVDTLLRTLDESKQFGTESAFENRGRGDFYIGLTHCRVPELFEEPDQMRPEGPEIAKFVKESYGQFNIMDEDGDGFISLDEAYNASDLRLVHIFERANTRISNLFDDGEGTEEYGVSRMDLKALEIDSAKQALFDFFNEIDKDNNAYISKAELEKMLETKHSSGTHEFLSYILDNFEELSGAKGNGMINRAQLFTGKNYESIYELFKQIRIEYQPRPC